MGIIEIAKKLGITKGAASKLASRGMPTHSVEAANAWRAINAPPRNRGRTPIQVAPANLAPDQDAPPKREDAQEGAYSTQPAPATLAKQEPPDDDNTPRDSLRRARTAERVGYNELVLCKKNGGSIEDIRKANSIYIAARNNRFRAEKDYREWQRAEGVTLFLDEAKEIYGRPHQAERQVLEVMPKTLAPRFVNQPQKTIELVLSEWVDRLMEIRRKSL